MSKGDTRRPAAVSRAELDARWALAFRQEPQPTDQLGSRRLCGDCDFPDRCRAIGDGPRPCDLEHQ